MDHRGLIAAYTKRISEQNDTILKLQFDLVDCNYELSQVKGNQAASASNASSADGNGMKMEFDQPSQETFEVMVQQVEELKETNDAYASWIAEVQKAAGVPACELLEKISQMREQIDNSTEAALKKQVSNYEKKIRKLESAADQIGKNLGESQKKVRKLEADLFRQKLKIETPDGTFDWKQPRSTQTTPVKRKADDPATGDQGVDEDDEEQMPLKQAFKKKLTLKASAKATGGAEVRDDRSLQDSVYGRRG